MTPPPRPDEIEPLPDSVWIYEREPKRARGARGERMKNFLTDWPGWVFSIGAGIGLVIAADLDLNGWQFVIGGFVIGAALSIRDRLEERRQRA
jgi:hypothetical protein